MTNVTDVEVLSLLVGRFNGSNNSHIVLDKEGSFTDNHENHIAGEDVWGCWAAVPLQAVGGSRSRS